MKVLYISYSGHAFAEEISPSYRQVELPDGFHVLTAGSVWKDIDHKKDAIMLCRQGITAPEGDAVVRNTIIETERLKYHYRGINSGRLFWRRIIDVVIKVFYAGCVIVSAIAMYLTAFVLIWATFGVSILG